MAPEANANSILVELFVANDKKKKLILSPRLTRSISLMYGIFFMI